MTSSPCDPALRSLHDQAAPSGCVWRQCTGDIYPLNHGTVSEELLFLINGSADYTSPAGQRTVWEWFCSVELVENDDGGFRIRRMNSLGCAKEEGCVQSVFTGLGMFRRE